MKMQINENRPFEELIGKNYGIVRQRLANIHCMSTKLVQARAARPRGMRKMPVALRRGWAKCVLDTMNEFQETYRSVMTGRL
jgi:hypothetical protein